MPDPEGAPSRDASAELRLFGGPRLRVGSAEVDLSPYQMALVGVVGWTPRPIPRSRLLGLLWDDGDAEARRHRLAQLAYSLNRKAGVPVVRMDRGGRVALEEGVACDAARYREAVEDGRWTEASELGLRGFVPVASAVSDRFEDWMHDVRRETREELRHRLAVAMRSAAREKRWQDAGECSDLLLSLAPADIEAVHVRIAAAARAEGGSEPPELLHILSARARRAEEDWAPQPRTLTLVDRWKRRRTRLVQDPGDLPLVGRRTHLERCERFLGAKPDKSRVLVLVGEPGIGKSRLLKTLAHEEELEGRPGLTGRASELARHFPISTLETSLEPGHLRLISTLGNPWSKVLGRFLLREEEETDTLTSFRASLGLPLRQLQEAFLVLMREIANERGLSLLLDDFQWADATSVAILDHVLRKWSGSSLNMIVAIRSGADAESSPGGQLISAIPDHVRRETIHVGELDDPDAEALVRSFFSGRSEELMQGNIPEILEMGGGNPFFLIELARQSLLQGEVPETGDAGSALPPRILEFIQGMAGALPPLDRTILTVAAAAQEELDLDDLVSILTVAPHSLFPSIAHLIEGGLLEAVGEKVRIRHDIVRDAVYDRLPQIEKTWIHGRLADAFDAMPPESPGRVALHAAKGGKPALAHRRALQAAEEAESKGATPEATEFLRIALETTTDEAEELEIEIKMANLLYRSRAWDSAEPVLRKAVIRWSGKAPKVKVRRLTIKWIDVRERTGLLDVDDAIVLLEDCKSKAREDGDAGSVARTLEIQGEMMERRGRISDLHPFLDEAVEVSASSTGEDQVRCLRLLTFHGLVGDPARGMEYALKAVENTENRQLSSEWLKSLQRAFVLATYQGEIETPLGISLRKKAELAAKDTADWNLQFSLLNCAGLAALEAMKLAEANRYFNEAKNRVDGIQNSEPEVIVRGNIGEVNFWLADYNTALEHFTASCKAIDESTSVWFKLIAQSGAALCRIKLGDLSDNSPIFKVSDVPEYHSSDLTMLFLLEAERRRCRGRKREGVDLLLEWGERLKDGCFFTTYLKLLYYAGNLDPSKRNTPIYSDAVNEAEEKNLTTWVKLLTS